MIVNGWFDWAIKYPGPANKTGYPSVQDNDPEGVVYHSAEGYRAALLNLVNTGPSSWTGSNMKNGDFLQHYPVTKVVWTNGSRQANIKFRGFESEGVAGEPLTDAQTTNLIRVANDMAFHFRWPHVVRLEQLWEHNEMTRFGAVATACPSGRIPWNEILAGLEDDMTPEECKQAMKDVLTDANAFPELAGKSVIQQIQASDNWVLTQIGAALDKAAEDLKSK